MKKLLKWLGLPVVLLIIYLIGPRTPEAILDGKAPEISLQGESLAQMIAAKEASVEGIKEDNQARIIWANESEKGKTPVSIVYLHGFSASQAEGDPVHKNLAEKFGCNLYLSRLSEHGVEADSVFKNLTATDLVTSAREAIAIGKQIGEEVIIVGTSTGGALGLYIAAEDPSIKALVCYSPIIDFYDKNTALIDKPWGIQLMRLIVGSEFMEYEKPPEVKKYWTTKYMIHGVAALNTFVKQAMNNATFEKVACPVFLGYYYKNDSLQDKVVSVSAMLDMYKNLGTPEDQKRKMAFPASGNHVIASYITSKDYEGVEKESVGFLKEVVGLKTISIIDSAALSVEKLEDQ